MVTMNMRHISHPLIQIKKSFALFIIIGLAFKGNSQINESTSSTVYDYLYRMAEKGLIKWNDYQLPADRKSIATAIDELSALQNRLTKTEVEELKFYKQEYSFDQDSSRDETVFFKKDASDRFRSIKF